MYWYILSYTSQTQPHSTMAKSTRSKVKRSFRAKKRAEGVYAATEAARLHRLSMKLKVLTTQDKDGDVELEGDADTEDVAGGEEDQDKGDEQTAIASGDADAMDLDSAQPSGSSSTTKHISTSGPRESRREQWRVSKGLTARPQRKGMNRQGLVAARRKSGRSHRRR